MKLVSLLSLAFAFMLTSCAQDYDCICTYTNVDDATDSYESVSELSNTKSGAQSNCDQLSGGNSYSGQSVYSVDCVLEKK